MRVITEGDSTYIRNHEGAVCRVDDVETALVMAAAPDLLAAAKLALPLLIRLGDYIGNVDDSSSGTGLNRCAAVLAVRDAIDKAESASQVIAKRSYVHRDREDESGRTWRVRHEGNLTPPLFNSRGAALAYLAGLRNGRVAS